jgi:hypothetical protein
MEAAKSCLGFAVDCGTIAKGVGVTVMGLILFVGSVYLLLTAILGRWMGFLVLMVCLSGWMVVQSSLWLFGFWSQGLETPTNLGPKGAEPAWVVLDATNSTASEAYTEFGAYPADPWAAPSGVEAVGDKTAIEGKAQVFLAEQLNTQLQIAALDPHAIQPTAFLVGDVQVAEAADGTQLAVAQAHYVGGGPQWTVSMYLDPGSVPRYSYMFLAGSIIVFLLVLPLLDRAEKKRKEFLTGGNAPAWYGPA